VGGDVDDVVWLCWCEWEGQEGGCGKGGGLPVRAMMWM
jgi:hypothetical protein